MTVLPERSGIHSTSLLTGKIGSTTVKKRPLRATVPQLPLNLCVH